MNRWLLYLSLLLSTLLLSNCSISHLPADQEFKIVNDLQGRWEGNQFETGGWHVYGDPHTGDTGASGTFMFIGTKVVVSTVNTPHPFWRREDQSPRILSDTYEREYGINANNEIVFPASKHNHKMIFRFTGVGIIEGYQDDFPGLIWKFHRVSSK
jgi:hypothetical protein